MDNLNGTDVISTYPNGTIIADRFKIESFLAAGGMAQVYVARQMNIDRRVAMKVLSPMFSMNPSVVMRFFREARVIAQLSHPNTVHLFDMGETPDKRLYMAMELLEGSELSERIRRGRMKAEEALPIVRQVAGSLSEAHAKGIIHRDLKPDNIFLTKLDIVKVLDFGIAKLKQSDEDDERRLTKVGTAPGTPEYMSPEQARGKELDARSDLYSLGVVLYEMLAGRPPFEEETFLATILMHVQSPPPPLPGDVPVDLRNYVINRLLAKDPNCRPDNADAFIREIDELSQKIHPSKEQVLIDELRSQLAATKLELLRSCEHSIIEEADADRLYSERVQTEQIRAENNSRALDLNSDNVAMPHMSAPQTAAVQNQGNLLAPRRPMPQMPGAQQSQIPPNAPTPAAVSGVTGAVSPNALMQNATYGSPHRSMPQMPGAQQSQIPPNAPTPAPVSGVTGTVSPNAMMQNAPYGTPRRTIHQMPGAQLSQISPPGQISSDPAYNPGANAMHPGMQPMQRMPVSPVVQAPPENLSPSREQARSDAVYFNSGDADSDEIVVPKPRHRNAPVAPGMPDTPPQSPSDENAEYGDANHVLSRPRNTLTGKPLAGQAIISKPPLVLFLEFSQPLLKAQSKDVPASLTLAQHIWNAAVEGGNAILELSEVFSDRPALKKLVELLIERKKRFFIDDRWLIENLSVEVFDDGRFKCNFDRVTV